MKSNLKSSLWPKNEKYLPNIEDRWTGRQGKVGKVKGKREEGLGIVGKTGWNYLGTC